MLQPFAVPEGLFPNGIRETKVIIAKDGPPEQRFGLGYHSHPFAEFFWLVNGQATVKTWIEADGREQQVDIEGPCPFVIEPGEEHVVELSPGAVLIGFLPKPFEDQHNEPSRHFPRPT